LNANIFDDDSMKHVGIGKVRKLPDLIHLDQVVA